ncbi:MAG TPA: sigma-70 family RNA polymerase sigma factor [Lacibacter sp.]|nr:sigma-70 family RNA polymerase sigma factor [Lacibacter sp.]
MQPAPNHENNRIDQELLERYYRDGDSKWLGQLLQRYTLLLLGVCMKYLRNEEAARDAVQQVFEKAIQELGKYRVDYFKSWIYMVAKNHCLMQLRHKDRLPRELTEQKLRKPDEEEALLEVKEKEALLTALAAALPLLAPEQRTCVELFYLQQKSYQQIAALTGYTPMQVKSYIQNGKRNLRLLVRKQQAHE